MKIGFIGCGNMGGALAKAAAKKDFEIFLADFDSAKADALAELTKGTVASNEDIAKDCDIIFLGVKPQAMASMLKNVAGIISSRDKVLLVSMAAGLTLETIGSFVGRVPIIRIMPNTPAAVGEGMILYCKNDLVSDNDVTAFLKAMSHAGCCDYIDEQYIDAASAVSGCGPAFVYMFIEALADGGVKCGLPRDKAIKYAAQTVLGAGKNLLFTGSHPGELKDAVCSPAGSTIEGVRALENSAFRSACIEAVSASFERTKELGKK